MIISKKVEKALNEHLILEMAATYNYLSVASWCEVEGYEGSAKFFYKQSEEENTHFMKFFTYINEVGGHALVPALKKPKYSFKSIQEAVEMALAHEQKVTKAIYKIITLAKEEGDHATEDFLRFFVDEQKEEEVQFKRILDKIKLIGGGPQSLYYVDREFERLAAAATGGKKKKDKGEEN
ncbi:MAG: ferritin [Chitinophagales bacterium]|nr:ferritin [Chitinophagales bacterium]